MQTIGWDGGDSQPEAGSLYSLDSLKVEPANELSKRSTAVDLGALGFDSIAL